MQLINILIKIIISCCCRCSCVMMTECCVGCRILIGWIVGPHTRTMSPVDWLVDWLMGCHASRGHVITFATCSLLRVFSTHQNSLVVLYGAICSVPDYYLAFTVCFARCYSFSDYLSTLQLRPLFCINYLTQAWKSNQRIVRLHRVNKKNWVCGRICIWICMSWLANVLSNQRTDGYLSVCASVGSRFRRRIWIVLLHFLSVEKFLVWLSNDVLFSVEVMTMICSHCIHCEATFLTVRSIQQIASLCRNRMKLWWSLNVCSPAHFPASGVTWYTPSLQQNAGNFYGC